MDAHALVRELENTQKFFRTTLSALEDAEQGFAPQDGMSSVAAQVAHVAETVDWFVGGAFGSGWVLEFEVAIARDCTSGCVFGKARFRAPAGAGGA